MPQVGRALQASNSSPAACLYSLLQGRGQQHPRAIALEAPGRAALSYGRLLRQLEEVAQQLNEFGVGRLDRVALVLPNGPEMAVAFLSVASAATCAPLNPAYRANEFEFYLADLQAKALILPAGADSAARAVAQARQIPVLELSPVQEAEAGIFTLAGPRRFPPAPSGFAQADDVALVLHTSGTTSRPKIVPLSHTNLCTSAQNIQATLALVPGDRCLNIMPLFHIHGLVGALLSSLAAGAGVVCTPGFYAPQFFEWLEAFRPTWYTAVPTMHQAIVARASQHADVLTQCPLRLIRSSSAPLPPQVLAELERVFRVPVLESYGMTEAAHQMASNPLPPSPRKAGSVGTAAGPEIAILDEAGDVVPQGTTGEIAIQGANVTRGYENNPEANASAFTRGWFRTGDQGYLDPDSYLFLTGRIKEIINRGGEKIAPREVDEVLLDHPAVAQAVAFALPHPRLGEEVAAAVVLRSAAVTEQELRAFAAIRLADFKVPRRILIVAEIPKGPTGKPQRIGLAHKLGLMASPEGPAAAPSQPPRTPTEQTLAEIWAEVLRVPRPGIDDEFLHLGGDSILAAQVLARVRQAFGIELTLLAFFETPTIAGAARLVDQQLLERADEQELDRQLAELAELSAEEVEQLLRQETQARAAPSSAPPVHAFTDANVALRP